MSQNYLPPPLFFHPHHSKAIGVHRPNIPYTQKRLTDEVNDDMRYFIVLRPPTKRKVEVEKLFWMSTHLVPTTVRWTSSASAPPLLPHPPRPSPARLRRRRWRWRWCRRQFRRCSQGIRPSVHKFSWGLRCRRRRCQWCRSQSSPSEEEDDYQYLYRYQYQSGSILPRSYPVQLVLSTSNIGRVVVRVLLG